jgi:hypothetical protein
MNKEVFFHVGLGKTGTTYLQYRVFPKLKGISYIQRTRYRDFKYVRPIERGDPGKYLVSNEFDRQLEREARNIHSRYPQAKIIIVLRRQDSWIASQYRRVVKNGYPGSFEEFIDIDHDKGAWERDDLFFHRKLELLEQLFGSKPLVLFQDQLIQDPHGFIGRICEFTGAHYRPESINLNRKHTSYDEKQLKYVRECSQRHPRWPRPYPSSYWKRKFVKLLMMPGRYSRLFWGRVVPESKVPEGPLISPESLEAVRAYYADDWQKCRDYATS